MDSHLSTNIQMLENEIGRMLIQYSELGTKGDVFGDGSPGILAEKLRNFEGDIQAGISRFENLLVNARSSGNESDYILQTYEKNLFELKQEFRKVKGNVSNVQSRLELYRDVDDGNLDVNPNMNTRTAITELMKTNRKTKEMTDQAREIKKTMKTTRGMFGNVSGKLTTMREKNFPIIGYVVGRIKNKKTRNAMILGVVVAICIILLFFLL